MNVFYTFLKNERMKVRELNIDVVFFSSTVVTRYNEPLYNEDSWYSESFKVTNL